MTFPIVIPPQPRYINYQNIQPYVQQAIPVDQGIDSYSEQSINSLIAGAESKCEEVLAGYFIIPIITKPSPDFPLGKNWIELSQSSSPEDVTTFSQLYNYFLANAVRVVYQFLFGASGEQKGKEYISNVFHIQNEFEEKLNKKDSTGTILYQMLPSLQINPNGKLRFISKTMQAGKINTNAINTAATITNLNTNWGSYVRR